MTLSRLIPMQPVADLDRSLRFYRALGFTVEQHREDWGWASLRCGECQLMLDRSIHLHAGIPRTAVLYLYPDDIADFRRRACANGLDVPELETTFYGMTEFRIEDPDGNRLWVGQDTGTGAAGAAPERSEEG